MVKIAVVGAGVNGLACAIKIKEKYNNAHVVIFANKFTPNTTGDGAGGLWYPYLVGDTPGHLIDKWGIESYKFLHQLWLEGGHDICLMPIYNMYRDAANWKEPEWANNVFGYHKLTDKEMKYFNSLFSFPYAAGHTFSTFVYTPPTFLRYLYARFKNARGEFVQATVHSLLDPILQGYDVVVNCTGLNARFIVSDDAVFPYRGQITKVIAPWLNFTMQDEDSGNYVIPNVNLCVLGGTHQKHDYNTNLYEENTHFIMNECKRIAPTLESAAIHSQWVGLRPGRKEVRVEAEMVNGRLTIHNYGHGGAGLTLFWGCATNVLQLLEDNFANIHLSETSKL